MPQASEELRRKWHGPSDQFARGYLEGRGFKLTDDGAWDWIHPDPNFEPNERDYSAMQFMVEEWDYGWWRE